MKKEREVEFKDVARTGSEMVFNSGLAFQIRLDKLFSKADEFSIVGNYPLWLNTLKALKRNLYGAMSKEEKAEADEYSEKITANYTHSPTIKSELILNSSVYGLAEDFDEFLRSLPCVLEITLPKKEDAGNVMT